MPILLHVKSVTSRAAWGFVTSYNVGACASPQLAQQELIIGEATAMEFTACDHEDIPVSHNVPTERFSVQVASHTHVLGGGEGGGGEGSAIVQYSSAPGRYDALVTVTQLGDYTVSLFLNGSAVGVDRPVTAICPVGLVELTAEKRCGCAAGLDVKKTSCVPCAAGTFKAKASFEPDECEKCAPGKYAPSTGATECFSCPASTYSAAGAERCLECSHPLTSPEASAACTYCMEGYHLETDPATGISPAACLDCDRELGPGSKCPLNSSVATFEILPGFWRVSDRSTELSLCETDSVCTGGVGFGDALCAPNHTGPLCEVCEQDDHYFDKQSDPPGCRACPSGGEFATRLVVLAATACLLVCLFALINTLRHTSPWRDDTRSRCSRLWLWASLKLGLLDVYVKTVSLMPKLKCLLSFIQILTVLPTIYLVSMPHFYTDWMSVFDWLNLDILSLVVPSKCITSSNATALTLKALFPLSLIAAWFFVVLLTHAYRKSSCSSSRGVAAPAAEIQRTSSSTGSGHIAVPSSPRNMAPSLSSGRRNLVANMNSELSTSRPDLTASGRSIIASENVVTASNTPRGSLLYSAVLSALPLSLGLLFCFFPSVCSEIFISWSCISFQDGPNAAVEFSRADLSLRCGTAAYNELTSVAVVFFVVWPVCVPLLFLSLLLSLRKHIALHKLTPLVHATAFLHREYRSSCFWWEPLELVRKLVLTGLVTRIPESSSTLRLLVALLVLVFFLLITIQFQPFRQQEDNLVSTLANILLLCAFLGMRAG